MMTAPRAKFGATTAPTPPAVASCSISSRSSALSPVVPTTTLTPLAVATRTAGNVALAVVKSTRTSGLHSVRIWSRLAERGTLPEASGRSRRSVDTLSSVAPTTSVSGSWHRALSTSLPILPSAPWTTTLIGVMFWLLHPSAAACPGRSWGAAEAGNPGASAMNSHGMAGASGGQTGQAPPSRRLPSGTGQSCRPRSGSPSP